MKNLLMIIRWIVGLLFIFSGLIKANDPLGLSYKMQEFFEVWSLHGLHDYTLAMSIIMNVFEVLAGVAVIIGWRMKLFSWLLFILIIFFTFLTGYALFSGKIATCGCFGDCLPLTPAQSFGKDLILMMLILILFITNKKIQSSFKPFYAVSILLLVTVATTFGQFYALQHLPFIDCLPFKKGNNILEQMKKPAGAVPDSFSILFSYQKNGKMITFDQSDFPPDFDSTYQYINRKDKLVKKGNGLQPKIVDFSLHSLNGDDTTTAVLEQPKPYILLLALDMNQTAIWKPEFDKVYQKAENNKIPIYLVTSDTSKAVTLFKNISIFSCDATVLKTAARVKPTYFLMQKADILDKFSYKDIDKVLEQMNRLQ